MLPLLGIVAQLFPAFEKQLGGGQLHEQSGSLQDQVVDTIKKLTGEPTEEAAGQKLIEIHKPENDTPGNQELKKKLGDALSEIAQLEQKERNRANEEAQRVELERYRMDTEERERVRDQQFQEYLRSLQDVQEARATQGRLAEDHNPLAWVAPILAFVLVGMIWYLLHGILTAREQVINRDVFNVVLGALVTAFTTVVAYYFGSSLGSSKKDEALSSGRLQTNPNMGDPGSSDSDTEASASTPSPSPAAGKTSSAPTRTKPTPVPTGIYGLFRQKAPGIMRDLIRDLGLSATQAAGVLGNIGWECGGFKHLQEQNPVMGGRGGLGWCQWTATRRTEFEEWLSRNGFNYQNDAANYGFLLNELRSSQAASVRAVRQTPNLETATSEFMRVFERPAARYAHLDDRIGLAKLALQEYERSFNV